MCDQFKLHHEFRIATMCTEHIFVPFGGVHSACDWGERWAGQGYAAPLLVPHLRAFTSCSTGCNIVHSSGRRALDCSQRAPERPIAHLLMPFSRPKFSSSHGGGAGDPTCVKEQCVGTCGRSLEGPAHRRCVTPTQSICKRVVLVHVTRRHKGFSNTEKQPS